MDPSPSVSNSVHLLDTEKKKFDVELKIQVPPPIQIHSPTKLDSELPTDESDEYEEDEMYDNDSASEDDLETTAKSLEMMCMSPPSVRVFNNHKTSTKHGRPKKSRLKKTRHIKRPLLVNSASNLENKEESSEI